MAITYKQTPIPTAIAVDLDGKRAGFIRQTAEGFTYYPASTPKQGGETYATLAACKRSLEGYGPVNR